MAVCAVSDIEGRLRRELQGDEEEDARRLIDQYQAELEELLGRGIERRTVTETAAWPTASERYYVKRGPIASVTSLSVGAVAVAATAYAVHRDAVELWPWTATPGVLSVTYVGGWDAERAKAAKAAVVARVCRMMNRHDDDDEGVRQSAVEGHSVTWMDDAFTEAELKACKRLRHPDFVG